MKRLGFCALLFGALVSVIAAQSQPGVTGPERASARPAATAATGKSPVAPRASGVAPLPSHRVRTAAEAGAPAAAATFEKYCSDCHTGARSKANIDFDKLTARMTPAAVAEKADIWDDVVLMLESRDMPRRRRGGVPDRRGARRGRRVDPHVARRVRRRSTPASPGASPFDD